MIFRYETLRIPGEPGDLPRLQKVPVSLMGSEIVGLLLYSYRGFAYMRALHETVSDPSPLPHGARAL